jgi:Zn-dependent protease
LAQEGGLRIGAFAGAAIIVQPAFLLLAAYVVGSAVLQDGLDAAGEALAFVVMLFAAVLIHELGHAGAAAALNIPAKRIVLTFFGGYVEFVHPPQKRWHEIVVSAAGPAANLLSAPIAWKAVALIAGGDDAPSPGVVFWVNQLQNFGTVSLLLGVFNLLPGIPLDGGHVLRAALNYFMDRRRAGLVAAVCGVVVALGVIAFAAWRGFIWSAFIGGLLGLAAWAELQRLRRSETASEP